LYTGKDPQGIEDRSDVCVEGYTATWQLTEVYPYLVKAPS